MSMHVSDASYTLNLERFDALTAERGWTNDQQRAANIGVSHTTLGRIRRGLIRPGARFIAQATRTLDVPVEQLFAQPKARS
jgi:transcriptional regulator with XRE-family HTH domain